MFLVFRALVLVVVALPLVAAAIVPLFGRRARRAALWFAILHLGVTTALVVGGAFALMGRDDVVPNQPRAPSFLMFEPQFVPGDTGGPETSEHRTGWTLLSLSPGTARPLEGLPNVQFFLGLDGINIWLVALCSLMMLPAVLVSWEAIQDRPGSFYAWLFVLQGGAVGAFLSFDVILFYVFFELTLIPAFFLIGRWGTGSGRRDAARKFFLYTLAGSLLTLVGVIGVVLTNPGDNGQITFSLPDLMYHVQKGLNKASVAYLSGKPAELEAKHHTQFWLFIALMAGFMVKVPVWPFHTWMPAAYGEAPIGVTLLLSAVLAKLGTFGILRFVLPLVPDAAVSYGLPAIGVLAGFGIVYGALCAFAQRDIRLMLAYGSLSHLGFLVLGIFAFNTEGLSGAVLHMLNHGLATGGLFAALGFLTDRYRTTDMTKFGGLMGRFPKYAVLVFVLCLASIGLPGLNGFVSEMLMLAGLFDTRNPSVHSRAFAVVGVVGIFLGSWYILTMLQKVFFNPLKEPPAASAAAHVPDLTSREVFALGLPAMLCVVFGLFPQLLLDPIAEDVKTLADISRMARYRVRGVAPPVEAPPPESAAPPSKGDQPKGPPPKGGNKGGGKGAPGKKGGAPKGGIGDNPKGSPDDE